MIITSEFFKKCWLFGSQNLQNPGENRSAETALQRVKTPALPLDHWREKKWVVAFKQIFPLFVALHLAVFIIVCLSMLTFQPDFSPRAQPLSMLWQTWNRWDAGHYLFIATHGYTLQRTVFFPLYSLLIRTFMPLFHNDPLITALLISSGANLVWMIVFYQLVLEDFGQEHAQRAVLYISIFPTAFFFLAAYTESLFLALILLSFYCVRQGKWWLSGGFGLFACLTHSTGIVLLFPFCYEYLRQHRFERRNIRGSALAGLLIPLGIGLFALYCWKTYGDALAFSHQEVHWNRRLMLPGWGIFSSLDIIYHSVRNAGPFSFYVLRNLTDLLPDLLVLALLTLACVGPWQFKKNRWAYLCYAIPIFFLFNVTPNTGTGLMPLESFGRYMLEVFPAFILLAILGSKFRWLNLIYLVSASSIAFFLLTEFLTGHWVI